MSDITTNKDGSLSFASVKQAAIEKYLAMAYQRGWQVDPFELQRSVRGWDDLCRIELETIVRHDLGICPINRCYLDHLQGERR